MTFDKPNQPRPAFKFPKCSFCKNNIVQRYFQHSLFEKWPFLHYKEDTDTVFCFTCLKMFREKKKSCSKADAAFVSSLNSIFTFFLATLNNILYRLIEDMQTGRMLH